MQVGISRIGILQFGRLRAGRTGRGVPRKAGCTGREPDARAALGAQSHRPVSAMVTKKDPCERRCACEWDSALVGSISILVVLVLLGVVRRPAWQSALAGLV